MAAWLYDTEEHVNRMSGTGSYVDATVVRYFVRLQRSLRSLTHSGSIARSFARLLAFTFTLPGSKDTVQFFLLHSQAASDLSAQVSAGWNGFW